MNKIFKVIWNHTTQMLTVVSELAKSHGKATSQTNIIETASSTSSKTFHLSYLSALVAITLGMVSNDAEAIVKVSQHPNTISVDDVDAVLADYGNVDNQSYGNKNKSSGNFKGANQLYNPKDPKDKSKDTKAETIAIGNSSYSRGGGIAIGGYASAGVKGKAGDGTNVAIAIGAFTNANGVGSIGLGVAARAENQNSFAAMRQASATGVAARKS